MEPPDEHPAMNDAKPDVPPDPPPRTRLEQALDYAEQGFHVFPLGDGGSPFCKKPHIEWGEFQTRAATEEEIRAWWTRWPLANIGLVTGIQLNVVDCDVEGARDFVLAHLTQTPWRVKTARGWHFYYQTNNASLTLTNSASSAGLDVRGKGGYVVAAGSQYEDGTVAEWEVNPAWPCDSWLDLPCLTGDDVAQMHAFAGGRAGNVPTTPDGEPVFAHLGAVSLPHDGAPVLPGGRNNALASLVGQWIHQGRALPELIAMARVWNGGLPTPLPDAEVLQTLTSVSLGHQKRHGAPVPLEAPRTGGIRVFTLADLEDEPPPPPETFWRDGVLFRGARILLAGAPKIGKSNFFLAAALQLASGGTFLGHPVVRPLKVLWMQAEIHASMLSARLDRLTRGLEPDCCPLARENFFLTGRCDLDLTQPNDKALIARALADIRPDVLCIDPFINFSSADENDNPEIRVLLRALDTLGEEYDHATLLVHHLKKGATSGDFDAIRGASAVRGWYDTGILLSGDTLNPIISYELRNAEPIPAEILSFDVSRGTYTTTGEWTDQTTKKASRGATNTGDCGNKEELSRNDVRVLTALSLLKNSGGLYSGELKYQLCKALHIKERQCNYVLQALREIPGVTSIIDGRQVLYRFEEGA
jgi:hypothetical protein